MSEKPGWREKLFGGFKKTSSKLTENLTGLITKGKLDAETLDDIEEALIVSDLGPATAAQIRGKLASERFEKGIDEAGIRQIVEDELAEILAPVAQPLEIDAFPRPQVILVIGVNGSGKTTTIAKLAHLFLEQDYGVMLAAGDTFRAQTSGGNIEARKVVICTDWAAPDLLRQVGQELPVDRLPVEIMVTEPSPRMLGPIHISMRHGMAINQMPRGSIVVNHNETKLYAIVSRHLRNILTIKEDLAR